MSIGGTLYDLDLLRILSVLAILHVVDPLLLVEDIVTSLLATIWQTSPALARTCEASAMVELVKSTPFTCLLHDKNWRYIIRLTDTN